MRINGIVTNLYGKIQNNYQNRIQYSSNPSFRRQVSFKASNDDGDSFEFGYGDEGFKARRFEEIINNIRSMLERYQDADSEGKVKAEETSETDGSDIIANNKEFLDELLGAIINAIKVMSSDLQEQILAEKNSVDNTEEGNEEDDDGEFEVEGFDDDPLGYIELAANATSVGDLDEKRKYLLNYFEYIGNKIDEEENPEKQISLLYTRINRGFCFLNEEDDEEYKEIWGEKIYEDFSKLYSLVDEESIGSVLVDRANFALQFANYGSNEDVKSKWKDRVHNGIFTYFRMTSYPINKLVLQQNIGVLESFEKTAVDSKEKEKWADSIYEMWNCMILSCKEDETAIDEVKKSLYKVIAYSLDHLFGDQPEKWADRLYDGLVRMPNYLDQQCGKIEHVQQALAFSSFIEQHCSNSFEMKNKWSSRVNYCESELNKLMGL